MALFFDPTSASVHAGRRVVVHLDLDGFYAQVESKAAGLPPDVPVVVMQWAALIAVNYPAKRLGIARFHTAAQARRIAAAAGAQLVVIHVDVLDDEGRVVPREAIGAAVRGDTSRYKVSLSKYRAVSRGIFRTLTRLVGPGRCEKASIDEAFCDVTAWVDAFLQRMSSSTGGGSADATTVGSSVGAPESSVGSSTVQALLEALSGGPSLTPSDAAAVCAWPPDALPGGLLERAPSSSSSEPPEPGRCWHLPPTSWLCGDLRGPPRPPGVAAASAAKESTPPLPACGGHPPLPSLAALGAALFRTAAHRSDWYVVGVTGKDVPKDGAAAGGGSEEGSGSDGVWRTWGQPLNASSSSSASASSQDTLELSAETSQAHLTADDAAFPDAARPPPTQRYVAALAEALASGLLAPPPPASSSSTAPAPEAGDALRLLIGAAIAAKLRHAIWTEHGYTSSCGVAHNKMLAKLASARNKPNKQTLIPCASVPALMQGLRLKSIRSLAGKLGSQLAAAVARRGLWLPPPPPEAAAAAPPPPPFLVFHDEWRGAGYTKHLVLLVVGTCPAPAVHPDVALAAARGGRPRKSRLVDTAAGDALAPRRHDAGGAGSASVSDNDDDGEEGGSEEDDGGDELGNGDDETGADGGGGFGGSARGSGEDDDDVEEGEDGGADSGGSDEEDDSAIDPTAPAATSAAPAATAAPASQEPPDADVIYLPTLPRGAASLPPGATVSKVPLLRYKAVLADLPRSTLAAVGLPVHMWGGGGGEAPASDPTAGHTFLAVVEPAAFVTAGHAQRLTLPQLAALCNSSGSSSAGSGGGNGGKPSGPRGVVGTRVTTVAPADVMLAMVQKGAAGLASAAAATSGGAGAASTTTTTAAPSSSAGTVKGGYNDPRVVYALLRGHDTTPVKRHQPPQSILVSKQYGLPYGRPIPPTPWSLLRTRLTTLAAEMADRLTEHADEFDGVVPRGLTLLYVALQQGGRLGQRDGEPRGGGGSNSVGRGAASGFSPDGKSHSIAVAMQPPVLGEGQEGQQQFAWWRPDQIRAAVEATLFAAVFGAGTVPPPAAPSSSSSGGPLVPAGFLHLGLRADRFGGSGSGGGQLSLEAATKRAKQGAAAAATSTPSAAADGEDDEGEWQVWPPQPPPSKRRKGLDGWLAGGSGTKSVKDGASNNKAGAAVIEGEGSDVEVVLSEGSGGGAASSSGASFFFGATSNNNNSNFTAGPASKGPVASKPLKKAGGVLALLQRGAAAKAASAAASPARPVAAPAARPPDVVDLLDDDN